MEGQYVAQVFLSSVILVTSVPGNAAIISFFGFQNRLTRVQVLIIAVAVNDIFGGLSFFSKSIYDFATVTTRSGFVYNNVFGYLFLISSNLSVLLITVVAVDRYKYVKNLKSYKNDDDIKRALLIVSVVVFSVLLMAAIHLYLMSKVAVTPQHKTLVAIPLAVLFMLLSIIALIRTLQTIYLIRKRHSRIQPHRRENEFTGKVRIPSFVVLLEHDETIKQRTENTIEHEIQTCRLENSDHAQVQRQSTSDIGDIEINSRSHEAQCQLNDDEMSSTKGRNEESPEDTRHESRNEARQHQVRGNDLDNDLHQITKMLLTVSIIHTCTYLFTCVTRVIWPNFLAEDVENLGFVITILQNLHTINFAINPIVYFVNPHFNKYCTSLFKRLT